MSNFTIKYYSEFASQKGETWRVEILTTDGTTTPTEITLDADEPLIIEWEDCDKHEPLQGATLTIKAETPTDRGFLPFIAANPLEVIAKVYMGGTLFWQGCLDAENYEEPYQRSNGYVVTITFTDFGQWKRIPFKLNGIMSIRQVIAQCMEAISLPTAALDTLVSIQTSKDTDFNHNNQWRDDADLSTICIDTANLYDEDGNPKKMYDAVEAMLQPLALRIIQRNGRITIYDLNALYKATYIDPADPADPQQPTAPIEWDSDTQTLNTDKQRQSFKVRFSPNGKPALIHYNLDDYVKATNYTDSVVVWKANPATVGVGGDNYESFAFLYTSSRKSSNFFGLQYLNPRAQPFQIKSYMGKAADAIGIAWMAMLYKYGDSTYSGHSIDNRFNGVYATDEAPILMQLPDTWCPAHSGYFKYDENAQDLSQYLRLKLSVLMDTRYNPFEDPSKADEQPKKDWDYIAGVVYVPYSLVLYDKDGTPIYQLISEAYKEQRTPSSTYYGYRQEWQKITDPTNFSPAYAFLAYYKDSKRTDVFDGKALAEGWTTNNDRRRFWFYATDRPKDSTYSKRFIQEGEKIPLPPIAGFLRLTLYCGLYINRVTYDNGFEDPAYYPTKEKMMNKQDERTSSSFKYLLRFILYKIPELSIVTGAQADATETPETEYKAVLQNTSIEELSLDTDFGTDVELSSMQKGTFRTTDNHRLLLRRTNTHTPWTIETDLLNMLISQYRQRCIMLKGECVTPTQALTTFTERAQPTSTRFIIKSEVLDAIKGTSNITFVELKEEKEIVTQ